MVSTVLSLICVCVFFFLLAFLSAECLRETRIEEPCSQKNKHNCDWDSVKLQAVRWLFLTYIDILNAPW